LKGIEMTIIPIDEELRDTAKHIVDALDGNWVSSL